MQYSTMAAHEIPNTEGLTKQVQSLPPELYTVIYDLTFTINIGTCLIDKAYTPPSILQVNQKWRSVLRQSYDNETFFDIPVHLRAMNDPTLNDTEILIRWLTVLIRDRAWKIVMPTLHILSDIVITTPIRRDEDESNDLAVSRIA